MYKTQARAMNTHHCITASLLLFLLLLCATDTARAQPTAAAPAPAGPQNDTAILEKAGQFSIMIRLLKSTQVGDQINSQLNNSNSGVTLFAPTDNAFSALPPGTLNSLTDQQKVALIQFHVLPNFLSLSQFQTVSNPLRTQAGNANNGQYPLNVTSVGNQVNITTGVVNTTVSNTIYSDNQLAVYQVDRVLLPLDIFGTSAAAPAPAPASSKSKKGSSSSSSSSSSGDSDGPSGSSTNSGDASTSAHPDRMTAGGFAVAAVVSFLCWKI